MEVPVIRSSVGDAESPWSPREAELLAVTLELLQEHGYDRLTVDAVATTARASKATIYRRWPTKAELVLAAFVEDLWDVLPGYLIYRSVLTGRAPSRRTIQDLVDNLLLPGLTRHNGRRS
jgi:AcrR family transcriptional regulator